MTKDIKKKVVEFANHIQDFCEGQDNRKECPFNINDKCELDKFHPSSWDIEKIRKNVK